MPHLLHYAKSKCRTAAPPHAAQDRAVRLRQSHGLLTASQYWRSGSGSFSMA